MKQKFVDLYMAIAGTVASASYANRLKVGAVAVKDQRILSIGYNGTPPGTSNECEHNVGGVMVTKPEVIHAEANCILKMARDGQSALGADLFVTTAPCIECAKMILTAGFNSVWYRDQYRSVVGIEFLEQNNVKVSQV
jgi:dCMP deaminase